MEYAIPAALVLLVITAAIVLLVNRAAAKGGPVARDGDAPGIGADAATPFGDTPEHAGVTHEDGHTTAPEDDDRGGGRGVGPYDSRRFARDEDENHVQRPGEAEGASRID